MPVEQHGEPDAEGSPIERPVECQSVGKNLGGMTAERLVRPVFGLGSASVLSRFWTSADFVLES